jgi:hypothetical protein
MLDLMDCHPEQPQAESVFRSMLHRNGEMSQWGVLRSHNSTSKHMQHIIHRHRETYGKLTALLNDLEAEKIPSANISAVKDEVRGYVLVLHHIEKECWQTVRLSSDPLYPPTFETPSSASFYTTRTPREIMHEYAQDSIAYKYHEIVPDVKNSVMPTEANDPERIVKTEKEEDNFRGYPEKSEEDLIRLSDYLWDQSSRNEAATSKDIVEWPDKHVPVLDADIYTYDMADRSIYD